MVHLSRVKLPCQGTIRRGRLLLRYRVSAGSSHFRPASQSGKWKSTVTPLTISFTYDILASSNRCSMAESLTLRPAARCAGGVFLATYLSCLRAAIRALSVLIGYLVTWGYSRRCAMSLWVRFTLACAFRSTLPAARLCATFSFTLALHTTCRIAEGVSGLIPFSLESQPRRSRL